MSSNKYAPGEKVFAKLKGFAPWPAKVLQRAINHEDERYLIQFYGTRVESTVELDQLCKYNEETKAKFGKPRTFMSIYTNLNFNAALEELENDLGTGTLEPTSGSQPQPHPRMGITLSASILHPGLQIRPVVAVVPPSPEVMQLRGEANSDFVKMLESEIGADVEIKVPNEVGGEIDDSSHTKMVHKAILMSRSTVFAKMFDKESTMLEAKTGKVIIKDLSPKGLEVFLRYLYTGEVLQDWVHVIPEIINAADKYDCGKLKQFCGHNLLPAVTTTNVIKMYKLAKLHNLSFAVKGIMEFIHKNAKTVITEEVMDQVRE